ncbi:adenylyl-sulfate kinase [Candidatus Pelagibacter bacterium nBUS_30]|uniref:adenylyl-sulfate kinase n=1 Tax=Candidatus Pelagibacter bacterium nBUS_30 TaxID=3374191 RepID=UPI003EBA8AC0
MTKGLWLFGLSGSGKTYLSKKISKKLKNPFIIDGDEIRKLISVDLGYKRSDRIKQNKRVLGLAKIVIKNKYYPIISSVYLDPKIFAEAKKAKIRVINVFRSKNFINQKLRNKKNVVGKYIKQPKLKCEIFNNSGRVNLNV